MNRNMAGKRGYSSHDSPRMDLIRVTNPSHEMGVNFHIYVRERMPCKREFPAAERIQWEKVKSKLEASFEWQPNHYFEWEELDHVGWPHNHYGIHLKGGVTCFRSDSIQKVQVIFDHDSDQDIVDKASDLMKSQDYRPKNRIGLLQMSYGTLNVKFVQYRPYELEISSYLGEDIMALKERMLESFNDKMSSGLYLIHGKPGTGKTSFLKEILNKTDKQALFIPPSVAGELGNPNLISLLMDHADSIIIIEDAETVLMKREADNSNAVSNLLNLTDGFPADFLNLNIICTFNTDIADIDPALLRKGRLKGIQEFDKVEVKTAHQLVRAFGSDIVVNKPMTIAEIFNPKIGKTMIRSKSLGFS